ncbi:alanine racemase [Oceanispirochaeta sp.]|uniref:alanine racemase n=1 Tax=Oceanispirochaeta sp. TaxID=2035350 RepID=UPI00262D4EF2|nr:alanine racemase [Oceanispirochaeta sp.]MDA3957864.1 alanine racemase [Oceanispirochaeta sp.]
MQAENKRATRAVIHLDHIIHNLECIKQLTGGDKKICIAVKADAYGHGALEISRKALDWGVDFLAVATVYEGIILRKAGIDAPLILFGFALDEEIPEIVSHGFTPFVGDAAYAARLDEEAFRQGVILNVHMKIDTGMGRIGVSPEGAPLLAENLVEMKNLKLEGVCTHLPVSDSPLEDDLHFTEELIGLLIRTFEAVRAKGIDPGIIHAANSGAIITHPEAHFDMVRPGICLYGYYPDHRMVKTVDFKPVMDLVSRLSFLKKVQKGSPISYGRTWLAPEDTWIATIPAGYADGYNRLLSSRGRVLVKGKSCLVTGRVCMDQFMIDLGAETEAVLFDEVLLFGGAEGGMTAGDIAALAGTIPYEITCNINKRVPRDYKVSGRTFF